MLFFFRWVGKSIENFFKMGGFYFGSVGMLFLLLVMISIQLRPIEKGGLIRILGDPHGTDFGIFGVGWIDD